MHACDQKILFPRFIWMPFYPPGAAPDLGLSHWGSQLPHIEYPDRVVIAVVVAQGVGTGNGSKLSF